MCFGVSRCLLGVLLPHLKGRGRLSVPLALPNYYGIALLQYLGLVPFIVPVDLGLYEVPGDGQGHIVPKVWNNAKLSIVQNSLEKLALLLVCEPF